MLNKKRVLGALMVTVVLFAGLSIVSTFEAEAHTGHPQKKLFDARWYQQVSGGNYAAWMTLSTSQLWLPCGSSPADCGSRWTSPAQNSVNDWNGQITTVDLAFQPDQNIYYDVNIEVSDLVLGDPDLLGLAQWYDSSYNLCFTCTIWYGWALISDLTHVGAYGTASARQATISHELGHLFALRHESVNSDESARYDCGVDDTGSIPESIMSYNCIDPVSLGGQGIYTVQPWDTCGVNHAYYDPTIGYAACNPTSTSFDAVSQVSVGNTTPGAARVTTTTFTVPHPGNINFASLIQFDPAGTVTQTCNTGLDGSGRATTHTAGGPCLRATDLIGTVSSNMYIGILNSACTLNLAVDFDLFAVPTPDNLANPRASTNIAYTQPQGTADRFGRWGTGPIGAGGGTAVSYTGDKANADNVAFKNYPEFLLDLFDADGPAGGGNPLVPLAVYGAISRMLGEAIPIYIATFEPGALAAAFDEPNPLGRATANLGYASQTVLYDPTQATPNPSPITASCSTSMVTTLNATAGGVTRATNPAAGTHLNLAWVASQRDLDDDGIENRLDTCPSQWNIDGDPRVFGNDPDGDNIDGICDPDGGANAGADVDSDAWQNQLDNCPLTANPSNLDSELGLGVAAGYMAGRANDGGPLSDAIGDACDSEIGPLLVTYNGLNHTITPSDTIANGRWAAKAFVTPVCYGLTDADGDGYCKEDTDAFDTAVGDNALKHNAWTTDSDINAVLGITSGASAGSWDTDLGGADISGPPDSIADLGYDSDFLETYLGTDARQPCALSTTLSDEPTDSWIFDTNDDQKATLGDVLAIAPVFLQTATTAAHRRFDWNADGSIGLSDVLAIAPVFLKKCYPVAQPQ